MRTPRRGTTPCGRHMSPLAPTPLQRESDGVFTPTLFYGATDFGTPSWGGDDAKMLQEVLSSRNEAAQFTAVTPGIMRGTSRRSADAAVSSSPRVFFKDQLTETMNFKEQSHSPLMVRSSFCLVQYMVQTLFSFQILSPGDTIQRDNGHSVQESGWCCYWLWPWTQ